VVADARRVAEIHVQGWKWGYRGTLPDDLLSSLSVDERELKWRSQLEADSSPRTYLLEESGCAIAFVTCGPARDLDGPGGTGEVYAIYPVEAAAGTGAGRSLMLHALEDLRQQAFTRATLWVLEGNARARAFYEAGGWQPDGKIKSERAGEGVRREVRYALGL
jgi:ribosomal protein S18 acetylase RimI-like enzyme